ncbi:MAG: HAMP domain-containing histidine kinase [Chthoniobacterales bacterium]|nr:HAMP domain-containing histidine kinase [Chthoniobacterales bacterium]
MAPLWTKTMANGENNWCSRHAMVRRMVGLIVLGSALASTDASAQTPTGHAAVQQAELFNPRPTSDIGCGISAEVLPRIFEPFVTDGKASGTGLGLAISKSIVDAHGGRIAVQSAEKAGTTFLITIPSARRRSRNVRGE